LHQIDLRAKTAVRVFLPDASGSNSPLGTSSVVFCTSASLVAASFVRAEPEAFHNCTAP
jgi:hypothetical protein